MVRGERWIVDDATEFADCAVLSLSAADHAGRSSSQLLVPFDRPIKSATVSRSRVVTGRRWIRHLHSELSELRMAGELLEAAGATIDILPFQLEPALALITGRASRFLLADEVGLGKTIQAGLMLAELRRRGWCERALILTPSGLRKQWAGELQRRFDISAAVLDADALSRLQRSLPLDVNPWGIERVLITSIDFIKQPEVLRGLSGQLWDLLIVDEAHQASAASLRYEAARTLARQARHVVLLTATPHAGDESAYRALCELGRFDRADPMVLFRRTRQQSTLSRTRRVHLLHVRLAPETREMHRALAAYVAKLWQIARATGRPEVQLAAMVLSKRAFSSAGSLASSIERRLAAISGSLPVSSQPALPFDADVDSADEAPRPDAPAFDCPDEEEAALRQLLAAARRAEVDEDKVRVLHKLLQRIEEPVIVFTEYRDTLETLERAFANTRKTVVLHGGQTSQERRDAVDAFTSGSADLLLATDAGAEGLNLQRRCRLVVNLELPWNPIRLEQRIGRVDRIGQSRTVHAIHLFADGTAEGTVLAALLRRLDRIQASEIDIAGSIIAGSALPIRTTEPLVEGATETVDLRARANAEAARLHTLRFASQIRSSSREGVIPVTCLPSLRGSTICFVRIRIANGAGRLIEDALVPILVPDHGAAKAAHYVRQRRRDIRARAERLLDRIRPAVVALATQVAGDRMKDLDVEGAGWVERALRREAHLSRAVTSTAPLPVQAGLFDNRALASKHDLEQQRRSIVAQSDSRSSLLEAGASVFLAQEPCITLMLVAC
ncbi:MAG TPA: helicase-related protein [Vicinamibacterales bacterium]|nr:helicase-related protein [Vicinamibacterales bacterium]